MFERLVKQLRPQGEAENKAVAAAAALPIADVLVDLIERATKREWLDGAEVGRREVYMEYQTARSHDMA